jgi:hypothetical protein
VSRCWHLFGRILRVSSVRSPSSGELAVECRDRKVAEEKFCSLFGSLVDGAWQLMFLRWSVRSSSRSFPVCGLGAPSCVSPLSAYHR